MVRRRNRSSRSAVATSSSTLVVERDKRGARKAVRTPRIRTKPTAMPAAKRMLSICIVRIKEYPFLMFANVAAL